MFLAEVAQIASFLTQQIIGPPQEPHCYYFCSPYSTQTAAQQQHAIANSRVRYISRGTWAARSLLC